MPTDNSKGNQNPNANQINNLCPAGSVCCPKDEPGNNNMPFWDEQTTKLLYVLSHGNMKGAPTLVATDPMNGWIKEDRIYGAGLCPGGHEDIIKNYAFAQGARSDSTQEKRDTDPKPKACIFECKKKGSFFGSNPCKTKNGKPLHTEVNVESIKFQNLHKNPLKTCKDQQVTKIAVEQCQKGLDGIKDSPMADPNTKCDIVVAKDVRTS